MTGAPIIQVEATETGAALRFPKHDTLIDSLKMMFPHARWARDQGAWLVPGKRAEPRARAWAAFAVSLIHADPEERDRAELDMLRERRSPLLAFVAGAIHVRTAYDPDIIEILKGLGARWAGRVWAVPDDAAGGLLALLDRIEALHAIAAPIEEERRARREAERQAAAEAELLARAAIAQDRQRYRFLRPLADLPRIGSPVVVAGEARAVDSYGQQFTLRIGHPGIEGHEGSPGCWVYTRPVTDVGDGSC